MDIALFIVGVGFVVGFALFTLNFYIREKRSGRKIYFLKEATALGAINGITNVMVSGPEFDVFNLGNDVILRFTLLLWILVFALMGLFLVSMRHETISWRMASIAMALGVISITTGFISLTYSGLSGNLLALIWKTSFALFPTVIFLYGTRVFYDAYRKLPEARSLVLSISVFLLPVTYILNVVTHDIPNYLGIELIPGLSFEVILDLVRIVFLLIVVIAFSTDVEYFYRIPIDVYSISINSDAGLNIYNYSPIPGGSDPNLFASALTAISHVMKESAGAESGLQRISTRDRAIIIENREEQGFCVTALVERTSMVLVRSVEILADLFAERYGDKVNDDIILSDEFSETDLLIHIAFPFLKRV